MKKQVYTRTEIFELLWMEAATKVAKRLGISDVGLAKWCKSNDVPKPKLGYWAKRAHGVPVPDKPKLSKRYWFAISAFLLKCSNFNVGEPRNYVCSIRNAQKNPPPDLGRQRPISVLGGNATVPNVSTSATFGQTPWRAETQIRLSGNGLRAQSI